MSDIEKTKFVRVWTKMNSEEVKKHLLLVDDFYGTCGNCKHLGLNYLHDKSCPNCKTNFKYIASSQKNPADVMKMLNRIEKENLHLTLIEKDDFTRTTTKEAVDSLFKKS